MRLERGLERAGGVRASRERERKIANGGGVLARRERAGGLLVLFASFALFPLFIGRKNGLSPRERKSARRRRQRERERVQLPGGENGEGNPVRRREKKQRASRWREQVPGGEI